MRAEESPAVRGFIELAAKAAARGWHERNGGNLSYRMKEDEAVEIAHCFSKGDSLPIGLTLENLAGEYFIVTGSGKFLCNAEKDPESNIGIVRINEAGDGYTIVWGLKGGARPTSEFPTHLLNHSVKKDATNGAYRVIYHAHPANIVALTFVLPLDEKVFTRELWQMITECPIVFPGGVGVVEWMIPGSIEIAVKTGELMRTHDIAVWAHHGIFCAGEDYDTTFGLMETVEKAAEILVKVISMGGKRQTISDENIRELIGPFSLTLDDKYFE